MKKLLFLFAMTLLAGPLWAQYNPDNPGDPGLYAYLTCTASPANGGSVSYAERTQMEVGSTVTCGASPNTGFHFVHWTENGTVVSTESTYSFEMPARDVQLTAVFAWSPDSPGDPAADGYTHQLRLTASPAEGGSVYTYDTEVAEDQTATAIASPNHGYRFSGWYSPDGRLVSWQNPFRFEMGTEDVALTGRFYYSPQNPADPDSHDDDTTDNIRFADPEAKAICVNSCDVNGDGEVSLREALLATGDIGLLFADNPTVRTFDEFQYFTGVTELPATSFSDTSLESIVLPTSLVEIGSQVLQGTHLKRIVIPNSVTTVGSNAFQGNNLRAAYISASVTSIGERAFMGYDMDTLVIDAQNPVYDSRDACNAIIETATNTLLQGSPASTIPATVTAIGPRAFSWLKMRDDHVTLPASLTSIAEDGLGFSGVSSITSEIPVPFAIPDNAFTDATYEQATLYVPAGTVEAYRTTAGWSRFRYITEQESEPLSTFDGRVLTMRHSGSIDTVVEQLGGFELLNSTITAIVWEADVPYYGETSFTNPNLLFYANEATKDQSINNMVYNGVAGNITLTDTGSGNCDFYAPQAFTAERISYTRNFSQQTLVGVSRGWETLSLPFTVQQVLHESGRALAPFNTGTGVKHFWLRRLTSGGVQSVTTIEANVPYIISMPNDREHYLSDDCLNGRVTFSAEHADVPATQPVVTALADSSIVMHPALQHVDRSSTVWALNVGEVRGSYLEGSVFERDYREVRPFEAYTVHRGEGQPAPRFVPLQEIPAVGTTGISTVHAADDAAPAECYDLQGRRMAPGASRSGLTIVRSADGRVRKAVVSPSRAHARVM